MNIVMTETSLLLSCNVAVTMLTIRNLRNRSSEVSTLILKKDWIELLLFKKEAKAFRRWPSYKDPKSCVSF